MSSNRRVEMVILSVPRVLDSIVSIQVNLTDPTIKRLSKQFFPLFKYHNPKLVIEQSLSAKVTFIDNSKHSLASTTHMHQIAQQIVDLNRDKTLQLLANRKT